MAMLMDWREMTGISTVPPVVDMEWVSPLFSENARKRSWALAVAWIITAQIECVSNTTPTSLTSKKGKLTCCCGPLSGASAHSHPPALPTCTNSSASPRTSSTSVSPSSSYTLYSRPTTPPLFQSPSSFGLFSLCPPSLKSSGLNSFASVAKCGKASARAGPSKREKKTDLRSKTRRLEDLDTSELTVCPAVASLRLSAKDSRPSATPCLSLQRPGRLLKSDTRCKWQAPAIATAGATTTQGEGLKSRRRGSRWSTRNSNNPPHVFVLPLIDVHTLSTYHCMQVSLLHFQAAFSLSLGSTSGGGSFICTPLFTFGSMVWTCLLAPDRLLCTKCLVEKHPHRW